jgi:hypothetical protein
MRNRRWFPAVIRRARDGGTDEVWIRRDLTVAKRSQIYSDMARHIERASNICHFRDNTACLFIHSFIHSSL